MPSFRTEKRAQGQQQRYQWFYGWGDITCLKQDPEVTHCCVQQRAGQDMVAVFIPRDGGIGGLPVVEELMAHQLPGKSQRDRTLTAPLISRVESSVLKLEHHWTSLAGAWGMSVGRSVMWVGCRWSRHWSCRGCTERKRIVVSGALTIQCSNRTCYCTMKTVIKIQTIAITAESSLPRKSSPYRPRAIYSSGVFTPSYFCFF